MSQTEPNNAANASGTEPNTQEKTFTQAELDTIIGERFARGKANYAKDGIALSLFKITS